MISIAERNTTATVENIAKDIGKNIIPTINANTKKGGTFSNKDIIIFNFVAPIKANILMRFPKTLLALRNRLLIY